MHDLANISNEFKLNEHKENYTYVLMDARRAMIIIVSNCFGGHQSHAEVNPDASTDNDWRILSVVRDKTAFSQTRLGGTVPKQMRHVASAYTAINYSLTSISMLNNVLKLFQNSHFKCRFFF